MSRLEITLPDSREIAMTREFDAPRHLVWRACTEPDLLRRWLGVHRGWSLSVCEIDLRPGGAYRYVWQRGETSMGAGGIFLEVAPPELLVATEQFDQAWYPGACIVTTRLVEHGGKTTLTLTSRYDTQEIRDAVLRSPATDGVGASYDRLAELVSTLEVQ